MRESLKYVLVFVSALCFALLLVFLIRESDKRNPIKLVKITNTVITDYTGKAEVKFRENGSIIIGGVDGKYMSMDCNKSTCYITIKEENDAQWKND